MTSCNKGSSDCAHRASRLATGALLAAVMAACASHPRPAAPVVPVSAALAIAHGVVSAAQVRSEKMKELIRAGVVPLTKKATAPYLNALAGRLRAAIAGNAVEIAQVEGALVLVLPARTLFQPDLTTLTPAGEKFLTALADVLRGEQALLVEAACHTDRLGLAADNTALSQQRADLVRDTLVARGLDAQHIIAIGSGDQYPVADNTTADGRRRNRRVEVSLLPILR
jgi:outer membrane protein OmpA-like peptidoglycan-associated protein